MKKIAYCLVWIIGCGNAPMVPLQDAALDAFDDGSEDAADVVQAGDSGLDTGADGFNSDNAACVYGWGSGQEIALTCDLFGQRRFHYFSFWGDQQWHSCTERTSTLGDACIGERGYYALIKDAGGVNCLNAPTTCPGSVH